MTKPPDTSPLLGQNPRGFTDPIKLAALELKARILSGETVPLDEIRAFILRADSDLSTSRVIRANPVKRDDVDFF